MKMFLFGPIFLSGWLCLMSLASPDEASAATITYEAVDLADVTPGSDLWQYRYEVSDHSFDIFQGFSVLFDPALVSDVDEIVPFVNADWDAIILLPAFPGDEFAYDALSLSPDASLEDLFLVNFIRAPGATVPGQQPFTVNAFDAELNFLGVLDTGTTQPVAATPVPEPSTLLMLGAGLVLLRRRRAKCGTP